MKEEFSTRLKLDTYRDGDILFGQRGSVILEKWKNREDMEEIVCGNIRYFCG